MLRALKKAIVESGFNQDTGGVYVMPIGNIKCLAKFQKVMGGYSLQWQVCIPERTLGSDLEPVVTGTIFDGRFCTAEYGRYDIYTKDNQNYLLTLIRTELADFLRYICTFEALYGYYQGWFDSGVPGFMHAADLSDAEQKLLEEYLLYSSSEPPINHYYAAVICDFFSKTSLAIDHYEAYAFFCKNAANDAIGEYKEEYSKKANLIRDRITTLQQQGVDQV